MSSRSSSAPEPAPRATIRIEGAVVRRLLELEAQLGVAYGPGGDQLIAEEHFNGHLLRVLLQHDHEQWTLIVRCAPPLDATVELQTSSRVVHQNLDAAGEARFVGVAEAWLTQGFDIVMTVASLTR